MKKTDSVLAMSIRDLLYGGSDLSASSAPYLRDGVGIQRYLAVPFLAGLPALLGGIYFFGWHVLAVYGVALISGAMVELAFSWIRRRPLTEGLFVIALFYSLLLPPNLPLWAVALGATAAMLVRDLFGGLGHYVFNPALVGKALLLILFPAIMNQWAQPFWGRFPEWAPPLEAMTPLTPLAASLQNQATPPLWQLLVGNVPGALGTTSGLLMLLAGGWLLLTRAVDWRISLVMLATVGLGQALLQMLFPSVFRGDVLIHLLAGSTLFTAFFIAPEPVTSPMTTGGKWIYAILIGLLILILRALTPDSEGVTFSVLLMNAFVPLLDKWTAPKSYGGRA
jgi:RnfABCDGE-type electron transport complex D subunit